MNLDTLRSTILPFAAEVAVAAGVGYLTYKVVQKAPVVGAVALPVAFYAVYVAGTRREQIQTMLPLQLQAS